MSGRQVGAAERVLLSTGTYDDRAHPRIRALLEGMRARDWTVDEVVAPLAFDTRRRVDVLRHAAQLPGLVLAIARAWTRLVPGLVRRRRSGPPPDAIVVGHLGHFDIGPVRLLTRPAPVVLDYLISGAGTAVDRRVASRLKMRALGFLDAFALRQADVVVVDTDEHLAALPDAARPKGVVVPVGADHRWFDAGLAARGRPTTDTLSVVFFGLFTPLQGTPIIAKALRLLDGAVAATIVGRGQDEAEVDRLLDGVPGVHRVPWVDADALPALVAHHDVCLGIFGTGDKARRVVPNKVYQGAAAGCAIVTSDTAPQRRALGEGAVYVPVGDAAALADALGRFAADRALVTAARNASRERAESHFTPAQVVIDLDRRLREMSEVGS